MQRFVPFRSPPPEQEAGSVMPRKRTRRAVVVGAGVVGLSCAWYLQEHNIEVIVLDKSDVAAGASWGNGGYLTPALAVPLPEPALLREGIRGLLQPGSPVSIGRKITPPTMAFLAQFAGHSTPRRWQRGVESLTPLCLGALNAFDELQRGGVQAPVHRVPVLCGFETAQEAEALERELRSVRQAGQHARLSTLPGRVAPLSDRITVAKHLEGQRYVDPGLYVHQLARSVRERGGRIELGTQACVRAISSGPTGLRIETWGAKSYLADVAVLATGAWLPEIARSYGVRMRMHAGRGYSFSVRLAEPLDNPVYLPGVRGALTPLSSGRVRVAGSMEIAHQDAPPNPRRIEAIARSLRPYLDGVDWNSIQDRWVGSRPLTADGLPVIGGTSVPGVFVAGGHGMWGLTLGPITGQLLASRIASGEPTPELAPFDPLRTR